MSKNQTSENGQILPTLSESAQRLEAIKNLIFGENIQQIDADFQVLKNLIDKRKEELDNYIEDTRKELMSSIDNLSTDLNIRITDLGSTLDENTKSLNHKKVDRATLGNLLVTLGEKIMKD